MVLVLLWRGDVLFFDEMGIFVIYMICFLVINEYDVIKCMLFIKWGIEEVKKNVEVIKGVFI